MSGMLLQTALYTIKTSKMFVVLLSRRGDWSNGPDRPKWGDRDNGPYWSHGSDRPKRGDWRDWSSRPDRSKRGDRSNRPCWSHRGDWSNWPDRFCCRGGLLIGIFCASRAWNSRNSINF